MYEHERDIPEKYLLQGSGSAGYRNIHLAGIVPVAAQPLDFNFPWHESLNPVGHNCLAVERAILECAQAGCKTIWVVCHNDIQPLLRSRVGDFCPDPVPEQKVRQKKYRYTVRTHRPIYYLPIHPRDRFKRDSLGWSILYGAYRIHMLSRQMSSWLLPRKYYVAFPQGVYPPNAIVGHRDRILDPVSTVYFTDDEGRTVKDGEQLGFTFNIRQWASYFKNMRKQEKCLWLNGELLPPEERYNIRHFSLDKFFKTDIIEDKVHLVQAPWYYNISSWEGLSKYLGSEEQKQIYKPYTFKANI